MKQKEITILLSRAEEHFANSEYLQAEELANKVVVSRIAGKEDTAFAYCLVVECCIKTGRFDFAFSHATNALSAAREASNNSLESWALNLKSSLQHYSGSESDIAIRTAEQAMELAVKAHDKKQQARALNIIGSVHSSHADYRLALDYLTQALQVAEKTGDKYSVSLILGNIALNYSFLSDYIKALDYYSKALELAEEIGNTYLIATNLLTIGLAYSHLSDYSRALDYNTRALALAEEMGNKRIIASALDSISAVHKHYGDYPRALVCLDRALLLNEETGHKEHFADATINLGVTLIDKGDHALALEYLRRGLELSKKIGHKRGIGYALGGIAKVHYALGDLEASRQDFLELLQFRRNIIKSNMDVVRTLGGLGMVSIELGKPEEGMAWISEAILLAVELGERQEASELHKDISGIYAKQGEMTQAFEHLTHYLTLEKEIYNNESKTNIEKFNIRIAIAEKEKEMEIEKLKKEQLERELSSTTLQLLAQTELLSEFREGILAVVRKAPQTEPMARELREKLKELPCKSIDWDKFETQFKSAHPEFRLKLTETYSDLSKMEIRICTLLRMNLKSPEISRLTCLSLRNIENHRYRIRKKMKLQHEDDLAKVLAKM